MWWVFGRNNILQEKIKTWNYFHEWLWGGDSPCICSCQNVHIGFFVCLGWQQDLPIHHSPWSAVSRGEDGSSKLGPCRQIRLPLSCVWHRRWISVSPSTQTSEHPPVNRGWGMPLPRRLSGSCSTHYWLIVSLVMCGVAVFCYLTDSR